MSRTLITPVTLQGPYFYPAAGQLLLSLTPCDPVNGNMFTSSGKDIIAFYCRECTYVYDPTKTYNAGDLVQMQQDEPTQHFKCIQTVSGVDPTTDSTHTYFQVYAGETFTIHSTKDSYNRTGDITNYLVYPGTIALYYFVQHGWVQEDGNIYFDASSNRLWCTVCPVPQ